MVPLLDLKRQYQALKPEIDAAVIDLLGTGYYVVPSGAHPLVTQFEAAACEALNVRHAVGVANGTDALLLSLRALGVGPGDEVITSTFSFIATAEVVSLVGATPVFVDILPESFNLDPQLLQSAITKKTRAIIPVHLFGNPADMTAINEIAARHGVPVLEDAAQAWGAAVSVGGQQRPCGGAGDMAAFSFFPSKNLGACGEGGLVTTNNDELAEKVTTLRSHGQRRRYVHDEVGYNSRLHAMQAAILNIKQPHAASWAEKRRSNAARYRDLLHDLPLQLPVEQPGAYHVYNQFTIRLVTKDSVGNALRDRVCAHLTDQNIGWAVYYPVCLHLQPVYESLGYHDGDFPLAEQAAREVLSLPIFPELLPQEIEEVAAGVRTALTS